jgi:hypothetical protein
VQGGVRIKLPPGLTWEMLADMGADEIIERGALAAGLCRCPRQTGHWRFRTTRSTRSRTGSSRSLSSDASMWIPIFRTISRPSFRRRSFSLMVDVLTPVQMEGLRLLLTPFPQEEFNQTEDRKVAGA